MGLGVMGQQSALRLRDLGFRVAGWSRTRKDIPGVESFAGPDEFDGFLARTDLLVSLLPATADTDGIINRQTIRKLSRKGPFGALPATMKIVEPAIDKCLKARPPVERTRPPAGGQTVR